MLILASASPSRARILRNAGVRFEIVPANVDEGAAKAELARESAQPEKIASALAALKALEVSEARKDDWIIGADQVLEFEGALISKCSTMAGARALLRRLRGHRHRLINATVLAYNAKLIWQDVDAVEIALRDFSDAFLDDYLAAEGEGLLAGVGCYRFEGLGAQLVDGVTGDVFSVQGLPLLPLLRALRQHGLIAT